MQCKKEDAVPEAQKFKHGMIKLKFKGEGKGREKQLGRGI